MIWQQGVFKGIVSFVQKNTLFPPETSLKIPSRGIRFRLWNVP